MFKKGQIVFCSRDYDYHKLIRVFIGHRLIVVYHTKALGLKLSSMDIYQLKMENVDPEYFRAKNDNQPKLEDSFTDWKPTVGPSSVRVGS